MRWRRAVRTGGKEDRRAEDRRAEGRQDESIY